MLVSSYMAGIAVFTYVNREVMTDPNSWDFPDGMLVIIIDFAFVGYLLSSGLVRDVFRDFPSSIESTKN